METIESPIIQQKLTNFAADTAIRVNDLSKIYRLYPNYKDRMKEALHPLRKKYHKVFYALKDVNFEVKRGEVLGIVGENGSGKSTLLKIIAEVLQPSGGWVHSNGKISALLELGSGFNPDFTGLENVYFYGSIMGLSSAELDNKREEILSFADIGEYINQPLKKYSSGMTARLAFAVATHIDPEILIIDEVLAVGDELFRRKCYSKIEKFMKEGKTILFVSHNLGTLTQLCNRAIMIDNGELLLIGEPRVVVNQYQRYLFAHPQKRFDIRKEIKCGNFHDGAAFDKNIKMSEQGKRERKISVEHQQLAKISSQKNENNSVIALYLENLKSESKIEYKSYDVEIFDYYIKTKNGHKVNLLKMGDKYTFSYNVKFNIGADNISFGMNIKNEKSIVIAGASSVKMGSILEKISPGETYKIEWNFRCSLLPNIYYINIGVSSIVDQQRTFLNRIVDALAFKVLPIEHTGYFGFVTLGQYPHIQKI